MVFAFSSRRARDKLGKEVALLDCRINEYLRRGPCSSGEYRVVRRRLRKVSSFCSTTGCWQGDCPVRSVCDDPLLIRYAGGEDSLSAKKQRIMKMKVGAAVGGGLLERASPCETGKPR